ncbi:hypothetical protein J1N35_025829, partial [Gossypium stocksii]
ASFHLPLHPFICLILTEYVIASGQLLALPWWTLVAFFIDYCKRTPSTSFPNIQSTDD